MTATNLLLLGVIICQLLPLLLVFVLMKRLISSLSKNARSFFEPSAEGKQSNFADILDNISGRFGAAVVASLKGFLMAENSAVVRGEKAAAKREMMAANPMLSGLAAFAPGIMNKLGKHPELAQLAMSFLNRKQAGGEEVAAANNGGSSNPFKI